MFKDRYVAVIGGCTSDGQYLNDVFVLDTQKNRWLKPQQSTGSFHPPPIARHAAALMRDNQVYVYGGWTPAPRPGCPLDTLFMLKLEIPNEDHMLYTWRALERDEAALWPKALHRHQMVSFKGKKLYLIGKELTFEEVWMFDVRRQPTVLNTNLLQISQKRWTTLTLAPSHAPPAELWGNVSAM